MNGVQTKKTMDEQKKSQHCGSTAVVDVVTGIPSTSGDQKRTKLKFSHLNDEFQGAQDALNHAHYDVAGDMK
eukprot:10448854-Ditylum_brightwellii.AAC.1